MKTHIFIIDGGGVQAVYQSERLDIKQQCDSMYKEMVEGLEPASTKWEEAWEKMDRLLDQMNITPVPWGSGWTYTTTTAE